MVRTRLAVGELLHRVFADEERTRGIRPAPGLRRLALDLLDLVGDGARQVLPLRRLDVFPCLFKVVFCHCSPLQRDGGDKRGDNARDSPSNGNYFHVRIIDKIPPPCNGKNRSPWALCVCNRFLTPHQPSGTSAPPQPSFNRHIAKPQPRLNHPSCRIQERFGTGNLAAEVRTQASPRAGFKVELLPHIVHAKVTQPASVPCQAATSPQAASTTAFSSAP